MRLGFVGDIALGDHPKTVGFGFRSRYDGAIPDTLTGRLTPAGESVDFLLGNLEFPLGGSRIPTCLEQAQCSGLPEYASFLSAAGVHAVNVANNHCYQHGAESFDKTLRALRAAGIHVVGTPDDFTEAGVVRVRDYRIALLGWSDRPRQYSQVAPPYNEFSDAAYEQIAQASKRADLVIVSIHWGDEFILTPSERERRVGRAMIDAGACLVIGHHPHVVREVERYGRGVIAYSLGNFVGDMIWDLRTRLTGWLMVQFEHGIASAELTPGIIDSDYFPRQLTESEQRRANRLRTVADEERKCLSTHDYAAVAEAERKRHAQRTGMMMLSNLHRYRRGLAMQILGRAIRPRLRRFFGWSAARARPQVSTATSPEA